MKLLRNIIGWGLLVVSIFLLIALSTMKNLVLYQDTTAYLIIVGLLLSSLIILPKNK